MREFWSVDVPWACFGIIAEDEVVVEAAPIANWTYGKNIFEVLDYYRRRGKIELIWVKLREGEVP